MILAFAVALVFVAFFAAAETAFVSASRLRVEVEARRTAGDERGARRLLRDPAAYLTTTFAGSAAAVVAVTMLGVAILDTPLVRLATRVGLDGTWAHIAILAATVALVVPAVFLLGDILPRAVARETAHRAVFWLAPPLRLAYLVLRPLVALAGLATKAASRLVGVRVPMDQVLRRDFELLLEEHREIDATPDADAEAVLANVLSLGQRRVSDVMTPRSELAYVDVGATLEAARDTFVQSGHSRLPVVRGSLETVVGLVFAFDLFDAPASLADMMRPVRTVPETQSVPALLREMLDRGESLVVVVDEYGGTAGVATREDLLEELFGDMRDEHDAGETDEVEHEGAAYVVDARTSIDDLRERHGLALPTGDYDTVGGYLLDVLGVVPPEGSVHVLGSHRVTILKATASRIARVRFDPLATRG